MNKLILLLVTLVLVASCKSSKKTIAKSKTSTITVEAIKEEKKTSSTREIKDAEENSKTNAIINTALTFKGTRYKYGGVNAKGMDCSGLIYTSFKENDIPLQRTSFMMATQGKKIKLKEVKKGDLLFFNTSKNRKRINHVGLVVMVTDHEIKFIHATTSRGVLISSLKEGYWNYAFVEARNIL